MKIVFVNRFYAPDESATSRMLTDLATALAAGGREVHVVTSRLRHHAPSASFAPRERIDGVEVHRVWSSASGHAGTAGLALDYLTFGVAASWRLWRIARPKDVVVAKTDPPLLSVPAAWVARMCGARLVNWLQDVFPEVAGALGVPFARGPAGRLLRRLRDGSLRRAAANVVVGERMRERVVARNVDQARVAIIANWADGSMLHPADRDANPLRAEWGLRAKFVVGYSGNLGRAHEFETVLDAASALRGREDIAFLFVGDGVQKATLAAASAARGLPALLFKPRQPREALNATLGAADVHLVSLLPALEGLVVPSKFYGIAAAGRPTLFVGDPDGEIGSVVRAAEAGCAVRRGDVAALVAAIESLRADPALRERMGTNARRLFEERFDKPLAMAKWRTLLDEVARTG